MKIIEKATEIHDFLNDLSQNSKFYIDPNVDYNVLAIKSDILTVFVRDNHIFYSMNIDMKINRVYELLFYVEALIRQYPEIIRAPADVRR